MFPVKCKDWLPVDHISIRSVAVRGQLGPITVWVSKEESELPPSRNSRGRNNNNNNNNNNNPATSVFRLTKSHWNKIYEANHDPSPNEYATLELTQPIIMKPGQIKAIYIHSTLPGDQAIVYDNADSYFHRGHFGRIGGFGRGGRGGGGNGNGGADDANKPRYEDSMIQIHTGRAHVSNSIFGQMPIWGWGNAWRDQREFVGQLHYGAVYKLWNPETQIRFGPKFKDAYFNLKLCQTRWESPMSKLPDECIFYILNMCRWDWFSDSSEGMKGQRLAQKQKEKQKRLLLEQQQQQQQRELEEQQQREREQQQQQQQAQAAAAAQAAESGGGCCKCPNSSRDEDDESEYEDAVEELEEVDNDDDNNNAEGEDLEMRDTDDDDDDDDDDYDEEEEIDEDDEEDWDSDDAWEAANGYRADHNVFRFIDVEEQDDDHDDEAEQEEIRREEQRQRSFLRLHVLRALARQQDEDEDVVDMHLVF